MNPIWIFYKPMWAYIHTYSSTIYVIKLSDIQCNKAWLINDVKQTSANETFPYWSNTTVSKNSGENKSEQLNRWKLNENVRITNENVKVTTLWMYYCCQPNVNLGEIIFTCWNWDYKSLLGNLYPLIYTVLAHQHKCIKYRAPYT